MITTSKVIFKQNMTFDVLFDVVIFVVVINSFWRCDYWLFNVLIFFFFNVLITLMKIFDVVMVSKFFNVLFGFRRCEIRSSDLLPRKHILYKLFCPINRRKKWKKWPQNWFDFCRRKNEWRAATGRSPTRVRPTTTTRLITGTWRRRSSSKIR